MKLDLFCKLMEMTTSDQDPEALVALRKAQAMLAAENATWTELLKGLVRVQTGHTLSKPKEPPKQEAPKKNETVQEFEARVDRMLDILDRTVSKNESFRVFVDSVTEQWKTTRILTPRQVNAIERSVARAMGKNKYHSSGKSSHRHQAPW